MNKIARRDFSTLPTDLLTSIGKRLDSLGDILRFRAVCNSFRHSIPSPKSRPSHLVFDIPFPCDSHCHSGGHFLLSRSTVYLIKPLTHPHETTQTWLVRVREFDSGKVRVQNPIFEARFNLFLSQNLPPSLNLLDYDIKEVTKTHHLELVSAAKGKSELNYFTKVVATTCHDETDDEFAIMALYCVRRPLLWRNMDKKWTSLNFPHGIIMDIIYHKKKFYLLVSSGLMVTVDPKSLTINEVAAPVQDNCLVPVLYVLKSCEDLFMLGTYRGFSNFRDTEELQLNEHYVYKLDMEKREWIWVNELEDRMFFLNEDQSFSVSANDFVGCEGNAIYYTYYDYSYLIDDIPSVGIFHMKDGYNFPNHHSSTFLLPPDWLKQLSSSLPHI